jgi:alpha-galactosidase
MALGVSLALSFSCALSLSCAPAALASRASVAAIAPTPPMGWSSWYKFGCGINETLFQQTARALVSTGMSAIGYRYVNIDDCWMARQRSPSGALQPNPREFPDGISGLAAYVHARGLKLGIYLDTGSATCTGFPGSAGHLGQDIPTLAAWKIDYVKADYCRSRPAPAKPIYTRLQQAISATGRPMLLNICEWGYQNPWEWGAGIGSTWRTTGDYFSYGAPRDYWKAILKILDLNAPLASFAHPGAWNDPNAMLIGTGALTATEERSQLSLWSILAAPLIAGGDLTKLSRSTLAVLKNRDVVTVDQDPAGEQGTRLVRDSVHQVWLRPLAGGSHALLLLNSSSRSATLTANLAKLGLPLRSVYLVRDLWTHRLYRSMGTISGRVGPHDVLMVKIAA